MGQITAVLKTFNLWMKLLATISCLVCYCFIYIGDPFLDYEKTKFYYQRDVVVLAAELFFFVSLTLFVVTFTDSVPIHLEIQMLSIGSVMNLTSFILCLLYYVSQKNYIVNSTLVIVIFSLLASLTMAMAIAKDCAIVKTMA